MFYSPLQKSDIGEEIDSIWDFTGVATVAAYVQLMYTKYSMYRFEVVNLSIYL